MHRYYLGLRVGALREARCIVLRRSTFNRKADSKKLIVFSAKMPVEMAEDLLILAKMQRRTRSDLIREGLEMLARTRVHVSDYRNGEMRIITFKAQPRLMQRAAEKCDGNQSQAVRKGCILVLNKYGFNRYSKFITGFNSCNGASNGNCYGARRIKIIV